eukprot:scaffold413806_cov55-Attheya_sp.AAC.1
MSQDAQSLISEEAFPGTHVFLTGVAYTRNIIRSKVDQENGCMLVDDPANQEIVTELRKYDNNFDYRAFIEDQLRFEMYINNHKDCNPAQTWTYATTYHDQHIYRLRSNYRLTRRHWVQLWAATVRECNGQMLHYL